MFVFFQTILYATYDLLLLFCTLGSMQAEIVLSSVYPKGHNLMSEECW